MKVLWVLLLASAAESMTLDKCTLAEELRNGSIVGYKQYTVEDYLCMALYTSDLDTSLHSSPSEYGIFQINSYWWCNDGRTVARKNLCGVLCRDFLDDNVKDDIKCLRRIVREPNGLEAWDGYKMHCKGKDLSYLTSEC
ncbi:lysozyme C, milk isozyme-like [Pelobates fuscus]|uniref:lysozyme C, milk isozyme-like n=1 Tax=Pelobates fuscus TaxID=191477 RepID=UPI002FE4EE7C